MACSRSAVALVALLATGCGPALPEGPVQVRTLVYDGVTARFRLADRTLRTVEDVATLRGTTTVMRGDARLTYDRRVLQEMNSCAGVDEAVVQDRGHPPSLGFVDDDGVLVPEDFDTLVMVSTYYNFEISRELFLAAGLDAADLAGVTTWYEPTMITYDLDGTRSFGFDNAAFDACLDAFLVFGGVVLQDVPLGANPGVAAHEYGHLAFHRTLFGRQGEATAPPRTARAGALLRGLNEGLADFFGAAVLGDPNFAARALTPDLSRGRDLSPGTTWTAALEAGAPRAFDPYVLGTVWGSTFWQLGRALPGGAEEAARLALDALRRLRGPRTEDFETHAMLEAVAEAADDSQRAAVCDAIRDRFAELPPSLPQCPP